MYFDEAMPAILPDWAQLVKYDNCCMRQPVVVDGGMSVEVCLDEWLAFLTAMHPAAYLLARALGTLGTRGLA